jgi:hypothetical protein
LISPVIGAKSNDGLTVSYIIISQARLTISTKDPLIKEPEKSQYHHKITPQRGVPFVAFELFDYCPFTAKVIIFGTTDERGEW